MLIFSHPPVKQVSALLERDLAAVTQQVEDSLAAVLILPGQVQDLVREVRGMFI